MLLGFGDIISWAWRLTVTITTGVFILLTSVVAPAHPDAQPPTESVLTLIAHMAQGSDPDAWRNLTRAAVEEGPKAFPALSRLLSSRYGAREGAAALAAAFTGHPDAPKVLLEHYLRYRHAEERAIVCFALPQRGTPADSRFLIRSLKGEQIGSSWRSIEVAALALGVLRDSSALKALEATGRRSPASIAANAAREAAEWIRPGPFEVPSAASPSMEPMLAVMAHGVPRVRESAVFIDRDKKLVWSRRGQVWDVQPVDESGLSEGSEPSISFDSVISSDGARAIVSVGVVFGRLNGVGYDYLLFRRSGAWRVVGIQPTWIS